MSKALKEIIQTIIPEQHLWKFELFKLWNDIIGPMKKRVQIEKIDNDTLYLNVTHATWAQEVHLLTPLIKKKINTHFNEQKIATIRIHNKFQQPKTATNRERQNSFITTTSPTPIPLTPHERSILAPLPSNELQSTIAAYFVRCKILQRSKDEKR